MKEEIARINKQYGLHPFHLLRLGTVDGGVCSPYCIFKFDKMLYKDNLRKITDMNDKMKYMGYYTARIKKKKGEELKSLRI